MKRKIIKQGHNTLTITLPSEWAKRFNLEAGSEIELDEKDNGLFLTTERNGKHKRAEFDITGLDIPTIWKYFMAVYREGYDEVLIKFNPDIQLENPYKFFAHHQLDLRYKKKAPTKHIEEVLQGFVSRFIGFEIVEHGKNYALIKEMGESSSKEFDSSLRRVFLLIQQMAEETMEALENNNSQALLRMHDIDINIDKFHDYCIRVLNKFGNKSQKKSEIMFSILFFLEILGDEYKSISHHLLYDFSDKIKYSSIKEVAKSVKEQFDFYYELFYKFDREKLKKMSELDMARYFSVHDTKKQVKDEEVKEIFHHLRIIARYINALTELRIEMEF